MTRGTISRERFERGLWWQEALSVVEGCTEISEGCDHCWASRQAHMRGCQQSEGIGGRYGGLTDRYGRWVGEVRLQPQDLKKPIRRRKPTVYAVWNDLFHPDVPEEWIDRVWDTMWLAHCHTFVVLTKRVERMVKYVRSRAYARSFGWTDLDRPMIHPGFVLHMDDMVMRNQCGYCGDRDTCKHPSRTDEGDDALCHARECPIANPVDDRKGLEELAVAHEYTFSSDGFTDESEWMRLHARPLHAAAKNVILGFSAEDQASYDDRMSWFHPLRSILGPEAIFCLSAEPLLGPIDFQETGPCTRAVFQDGQRIETVPYLSGVIVGGETGPKARRMDPDWVRSIRDQCVESGVPFFFKSWGGVRKAPDHRLFDGRTWDELPWLSGERDSLRS